MGCITDVSGIRVGHITLIEGNDIRTGVTAILPHNGNVYQVEELGEIETPIILTNTLAVPRATEALIDWTLTQAGNEGVQSVNPIVGETNDGTLNNIRNIAITKEKARQALKNAESGPVGEGCVGVGRFFAPVTLE